jgi:hypothetical protein
VKEKIKEILFERNLVQRKFSVAGIGVYVAKAGKYNRVFSELTTVSIDSSQENKDISPTSRK